MRFGLPVVFCLFTVLASTVATGSQPVVSDLPPEYIIERLKEVRQGWDKVEIEFVVFQTLPAFSVEPRIVERGRFVLTPPDCGTLETLPVDDNGCNQEEEPVETYVWTPEEFQIHSSGGHIETILRSELRARKGRLWAEAQESTDRGPSEQEPNLLQCLVRLLLPKWEWCLPVVPDSPKGCLPLVFADGVEALAERFELTVKESDEYLFLFARPRLLEDQRCCRETAICIDRKTFVPIAKRTLLPNGCGSISYVVTSLRVNGKEVTIPTGDQQSP